MGHVMSTLANVAFIRGTLDLTMALHEFIRCWVSVISGYESNIGAILFSIFTIAVYTTASIASWRLFARTHRENPRPFLMKYYILTAFVIFCAVLSGIKYMSENIGYTIVFFLYASIVLALHIWLQYKEDKKIQMIPGQETVFTSSGQSELPMFEMPVHVERAEVRDMEPMNNKTEDAKQI